jgi:hypothetical protein
MPSPSECELRRGEEAAWGPRPATRMRLLAWRPTVKNSLRGFADLKLPIGLKIHDVPVWLGPNGAWASLPSKPQIDKQGRQKVDANDRGLYVPLLEWRDKALRDRFSAAVVALVCAAHPDALEGGQ